MTQYPDSTSYLIDKMFEGGSSSGLGGSAPGSTVGSESEVAPEKQMYKEAAANDRTRRSTSSATSASAAGKHPGKPPKTTSRKSSAAPVSGKRTSASGKSVQSASSSSKSVHDTTVAAVKSHSKRQAAPSPPKICDNDDSDDDNGDIVEEDDLQITEEEEEEAVGSSQALEDGEVSDKASEAGTYVIDAADEDEEGEEEEEEARRKIDEVFGVDKPHSSVDPLRLASPGGYDNVYDDDAFDNDETVACDDIDGEEGEKTPLEGHSPLTDDDEEGIDVSSYKMSVIVINISLKTTLS